MNFNLFKTKLKELIFTHEVSSMVRADKNKRIIFHGAPTPSLIMWVKSILSHWKLNTFRLSCRLIAVFFIMIFFVSSFSLLTIAPLSSILHCFIMEELIYSIKLSLVTSSIATLLVMIVAVLIAFSLSEDTFTGKSIVKTIMDLPIAFPEILMGMLLLIFFGNTPLSNLLAGMGVNIVFTELGIVCAQFFVALPYAVKICYSAFAGIDKRLKFVSRSLGYTEFETFKNIILPLSKKGIFAATIVTFSRCIGSFGAVLILGGGTYHKTDTLPIALYLNLSYGNMEMMAAAGVLLMLIAFVTIFVIEKIGGDGNYNFKNGGY